MEPVQHPDPLEEALSAASQRVAQLASLAAAGAQVYIQRRALREAGQAASDEHAARLLREHDRLATQQARLTWMPAHDPAWLADAGLEQAGRAWAAAVSHADTEPTAASAMRKSEDRLRQLHPYAMARYDRLRADGADPFDAMRQAAPLFARSPRPRTGQPAPTRLALPAQTSDEHHPAASPASDGPAEPAPGSDPGEQAERRGQHIAEQLQDRARATGRPPLGPDELTTVLETITNLPDEVITAIASQAPRAEHAHLADGPSVARLVVARTDGGPLPGATASPPDTSLIGTAPPAAPADRSPAHLAAISFPHTAADAIQPPQPAEPTLRTASARYPQPTLLAVRPHPYDVRPHAKEAGEMKAQAQSFIF